MSARGYARKQERGRRVSLVLPFLLVYTLPLFASAQVPDSTRARPDSLIVAPALVAPPGPDGGRVVTPIPYTTPALDPADLLADAPGVFAYDLGLPGAADGLSLDGLGPERTALSLDGRPLMDLFTGRPRTDLLPMEALDGLRLDASRYGRPGAVVATTRPFRFAAPVTELRYLPGQEGLQYIGVTHAQTRLPPGFLRDSAGRARWTVLGHIAGRTSTGLFSGGTLGGWNGMGRITYARPGLTAVLTETHVRRPLGARRSLAPSGTFSTVFNPSQALVQDGAAQRETLRNDLALDLHLPLLGTALSTVTAYWTRQHERYIPLPGDTLEAKGNRFGGRFVQAVRAGRHGLTVTLDGWLDGTPWGQQQPYLDTASQTQVHAVLRDSLTAAGFRLDAEVGAHAVGETVFPSGALRTERGGVYLGVRYAGAAPGRIERGGYSDFVFGTSTQTEATLSAQAGWTRTVGAFDVGLHAFASQTMSPRVLAADDDTQYVFVDLADSFRRVGGTAVLGWRARAERGLYATASVATHHLLDPDRSLLTRREADALPGVWGHGRWGLRALGLFENRLDLDLAVRGRAWRAFRSRAWVPAVALFALPDPSATLDVPARGTLDLVAEARFRGRATLYLLYENVLATRAYDGAYVVPVFPIPAHRLRFGVAWALFD